MNDIAPSERAHILLKRLARANAIITRCTEELFALFRGQAGGDPPLLRLTNLAGSLTSWDKGVSLPIVDVAAMTVTWRGRTCALGNTVLFQMIERLARRPNQFISFDRLRRDVWHGNVRSDETIRSSARNLKRRLVDAGMAELAAGIRTERRHYGLFL